MTILCLILTGVLGLAADVLAKKGMFWAGVFTHLPGCVLWVIALTKGPQLSIIGLTYGVGAVVATVIVGHVFLGDSLTTSQWAGVFLGLVSLGLLL